MSENTGEYHRLSRKCILSQYVGYLILLIVLAFVWAVVAALTEGYAYQEMIVKIVLVLYLVLCIYCIIAPPVFYRHYKYLIDGEKIDVVKGVLTISRTVVPLERIMQVNVTRGPINRMFGLADVDVTTAGGVASVQYLDPAEADRVADELSAIVDRILKERGQA